MRSKKQEAVKYTGNCRERHLDRDVWRLRKTPKALKFNFARASSTLKYRWRSPFAAHPTALLRTSYCKLAAPSAGPPGVLVPSPRVQDAPSPTSGFQNSSSLPERPEDKHKSQITSDPVVRGTDMPATSLPAEAKNPRMNEPLQLPSGKCHTTWCSQRRNNLNLCPYSVPVRAPRLRPEGPRPRLNNCRRPSPSAQDSGAQDEPHVTEVGGGGRGTAGSSPGVVGEAGRGRARRAGGVSGVHVGEEGLA